MMSDSKGRKTLKAKSDALHPPKPYEIDMTKSAEAVYREFHRKSKEAEKRGDYASQHCTTFRTVREGIREIIPRNPFAKQYGLRGEFSNMFRLRKGRLRIIWIASSRVRRICILLISETLRKEGDVTDPYVILHGMVATGQFDELFKRYGVRMHQLAVQMANPGSA